jgi:hypothetical protein
LQRAVAERSLTFDRFHVVWHANGVSGSAATTRSRGRVGRCRKTCASRRAAAYLDALNAEMTLMSDRYFVQSRCYRS